MNTVVSFRLCTLSDEELVQKVNEGIDNMYKHMKLPDRHIPARPNQDFDLLVGELLVRFQTLIKDTQ